MNIFFLVLIFCFFVFLYVIYYLSHDDFVILRNDINMEKIFNLAFIFSFVSLFSSRFFYVLFNPAPVFYNILGFLLFPYFPGLSLSGGIIGGFLFLVLYLKLRKFPFGRLLDFFSMGFLIASPFGLIGYFLLSFSKYSLNHLFSIILIFALVFLFVKFILPISLSEKLKDGSLAYIFLVSFSGVFFLINMILNRGLVISKENIMILLISLVSIVPLIKQEGYDWYQNYLRRR